MTVEGDYYRLLGVSADAERDAIREAYRVRRDELANVDTDEARAEVAQLNRAWNVLSDPIQRGRYDADLADAKAGDDWVEVESDATTTPAENDNKRMTFREARQQMRNQQAQRSTEGAVVPGHTLPAPRKRLFAFMVDLVVLAAIVIAGGVIGTSISNDRYPDEHLRYGEMSREYALLGTISDRLDAEADLAKAEKANDDGDIESANDAITSAEADFDDGINTLEERVTAAENSGDTSLLEARQAELEAATGLPETYDTTKKVEDRRDKLDDDLKSLSSKINGPITQWGYGAAALGLLILLFPSALTGQTLGKKLFKLRLVRDNGAKAGFGASFVHYGLPVIFTVLTLPFLQVIGLGVAVFGVTTFMRSPKQQGWHDRIAHTAVVEA